MAAVLCKFHVLSSPFASSRPSCAQIVPLASQNVGSHRKNCQTLYSNWRENALRYSHQVPVARQQVRRSLGLPVAKASTGASGSQQEEEAAEKLPAIETSVWKKMSMHAVGALLVGTIVFGVAPAQATDALKTCACLLKECRIELARCIADPACAANVACLQTCNNRPDETECQIGCGDLFENQVVDQFNDCAVSKKGCVPQKQDEGRFPIPGPNALVQDFNVQDFTGKWYITSGLNKTFDTFDCQLHEFSASPDTLTGKLTWRIATPDGGFFTRSAVQNFVQNEGQPGQLYNHGNEFLHYQDDWYILSSKIEKGSDDYVFVYYRGSNDAWDGYGGAVVYTRSKTLPQSIIPELSEAARKAGLDFTKFTTTDNTCGPEPPLFARLEKKVEDEEQVIEKEVEEEEMFIVQKGKEVVNSIGTFIASLVKGEVDFFNQEAEEFKRDEELLFKNLGDEEKKVLEDLNMEAQDIERLFGKALPIRKIR
ncbi:unnamed protein product [Calypogeia fissa]